MSIKKRVTKQMMIALGAIVVMLLCIVAFFVGSTVSSKSSVVPPSYALSSTLWEPDVSANKIVVLSDLHLGIDDGFSETVKDAPMLVNFIRQLSSTSDVRELVIAGDFLDEWYLPMDYPSHSDSTEFYEKVIANNQPVMNALKDFMASGKSLVYVIGNHDITLENDVLEKALPGIKQCSDIKGLGVYRTGDRNEIVVEHGHRYDIFSAPDTLTNKELTGSSETILPAGYFYARLATSWVLEGRPSVSKNYPVIDVTIDPATDPDQFGALLYYKTLNSVASKMTPYENFEDKVINVGIAGFNGQYSFQDFYPVMQKDGTISAPVLYKNIQRTWDERQTLNKVNVKTSFIESVMGMTQPDYFFRQAKKQYLENATGNADVVVFGHSHVPYYQDLGDGKYYVNDGTWVDNNSNYPEATRTVAVITTGEKDKVELYRYEQDGNLTSIKDKVVQEIAQAQAAE